MRAGAAGPAHWGRRGAGSGERGRGGGCPRGVGCGPAELAREGVEAAEIMPPVAPGTRPGHCPLSTPRSRLRAPRSLFGTLVPRPPTPGLPEAPEQPAREAPRVFILGDLRSEGRRDL